MDNKVFIQIEKFLNSRRFVFFNVASNPKKQQIIINAENILPLLKQGSEERIKYKLKKYASEFIAPLLPAKTSKHYQTYNQLYNQLINL